MNKSKFVKFRKLLLKILKRSQLSNFQKDGLQSSFVVSKANYLIVTKPNKIYRRLFNQICNLGVRESLNKLLS